MSLLKGLRPALVEILPLAIPLMISTGIFSLVLFADRTFLLWYDPPAMSASMASGNLFWVLACTPVGTASMSGAIIGQYLGKGDQAAIGRFLWQTVWFSLLTVPYFAILALWAPKLFSSTGQPDGLIEMESTYFRWLMFGAVGCVLENALAGFFSAMGRTGVILWAALLTGIFNVGLDIVLIFGWGPIPALGIFGAAMASALAFWLHAGIFAWFLWTPETRQKFGLSAGRVWETSMFRRLLYFGGPSGLMYLIEAGAFAAIVLKIGSLGDLPLRATTMAINFNMVAFIPLVGVSIAVSVLVGRHLTESGPLRAASTARAGLLIALIYSGLWALAYHFAGRKLMRLYSLSGTNSTGGEASDDNVLYAMDLGEMLLGFVAIYIVFDALQITMAGALRGAGDTWFVMAASLSTTVIAISLGWILDPRVPFSADSTDSLMHWWWVLTGWIVSLALLMVGRYLSGRWKGIRMV
ncbi:MAG: MATE family efflux transporter [Planctomycetota bacterium]